MARAFGLTAAEMIGRNVFVGIPPELAAERSALLDQVIKTKQAIHYEEQVGARFYDTMVTPIMNSKGEVINVAVFPHDITERKRTCPDYLTHFLPLKRMRKVSVWDYPFLMEL